MKTPLILEIKGNSLDDGPGIRSVVFFKGCPLTCKWCHNPEGQNPGTEIAFDNTQCIACGTCLETCQESALSQDNPFYIDRKKCDLCFACVDTCPSGALSRVGLPVSMDTILQTTLKDSVFFRNSGGGVTLSGGEPTLFMDFTSELLQALKAAGIHTLVETCGMFDLEEFEKKLYPYIDMIYYDIKLMDTAAHHAYCGVPNEKILANFRYLHNKYLDGFVLITPRTPLIPGITDTAQNLSAIAQFLKSCNVGQARLLDYHPLWRAKNRKIGREDPMASNAVLEQFLSSERRHQCRRIFEAEGIQTGDDRGTDQDTKTTANREAVRR